MRCEICGRSCPVPTRHTCPQKLLRKIDRDVEPEEPDLFPLILDLADIEEPNDEEK